jgi:RHS repeat-associated protein
MTSVTKTGAGAGTDTFGYDDAGNMATRTVGGLRSDYTFNSENQFATAVVHTAAGDQETRHLYDANGALLIRRDPGGTTLYAAGQEFKLTGGSVACTRYYAHGGATVAVRTAAGVTVLAADHQGSANLAVNAATGEVTKRWYTPYGADRSDVSWPTDRGFLGKQNNTSTGLIDVGAREYDPSYGTFVSPDPLLRNGDPRTYNPYAYASHSPATQSDPSGLVVCADDECQQTAIRNPDGGYTIVGNPRPSGARNSTTKSNPVSVTFPNGTSLEYHTNGSVSINGYELAENHPDPYVLASKADGYREHYPVTGNDLEDLWATVFSIDVACEELQCRRGLGKEFGQLRVSDRSRQTRTRGCAKI